MYYRQLLSSNQANNFEFIRYSDSTRQSSLSFLSSRISNIDKYLHENDKIISLRNSESLFNDLMKYLPRIFTIKTNNGSCFFNIELLKNSSSVISIFLEENPNIMEYHIDVDDNDHILEKFEKLYQGDHVIFEENELPTSKKITGLLNIRYCPNYLKPESLKEPEPGDFNIGLESGVIIGKTKFNRFISQTINQTFKIITNQKEYKCNFFGVFSSKKIRSFIADNPTTYQFKFDFDDESDEFQLICNFFNFERVEITSDNIDFLKEMCDDLEIESISPQIDKYLQQYENLSKTIDDQQNIVDLIEDLFGWLYDIEKISVESVKEKILNSEWIKTEDQIFELAAFMIQVIDSSINLHPYLIDLLIQLDKESDKTNKLNLLLPCICENLFISFGSSFSNCSFIYMLHKKGFITKEQLIYKIKQSFGNKRQSKEEDNIQIWFLPELVELKITSNLNPLLEFKMKNIQRISVTEPNNTFRNKDDFIYFYYPNKMEEFIKMRDSGEPEDELTKAIRKDDVDKVQSILSKREIDFSRYTIPFNIFDDLEENGRMKIIDYAAANGSLKCFKYMLLNQSKISELTFQYAISGYNTEIIKIVEQNLNSQNQSIEKYMHTSISKSELQLELTPILFSICKHQNNLFDYLFEQKYSKNINEDAKSLLKSSVLNGNAHSFIEIINKCEKSIDFQQLIDYASKKGFYQLSCLIYNFVNNPNDIIKFSSRSINEYMKIGSEKRVNLQFNNNFVYFGNLSIYKLGLKLDISSDSIKSALLTCLEREHKNIFDYVLDNYIKDDKSEQFVYSYEKVACKALECQDNYFFDHFIEYIKISNPDFFTKYTFQSLIETACQTNKIEKVKLVYKLMDENKSKINIASVFINLSRYENIKIEKDIFEVIIDKCCPEIRESILLSSLYLAINNKNKELVQFILNQNVLHEDALIVASENNDLDIVNVILDHDSDATFINRKSEEGTALYIAAKNNNLEIVKRLLSLPGIDPSLCGKRIDQTPLIASLNNLNVDIISSILGFYGEKIQSQTSQLNRMIELILEMLSSDSYRRNEEKNAKLLTILKKILEIKSIDLNCRGGEYTLLSYACEINEISLVQMLLETERVDINSYSTSNGSTPLMIAILNKNIEIAELLLKDKRTNINARNCKNQTALTIAVEQQLENIVSLIINNEKFNPKESSIDYAFYISNGSISNLLLSVKSVDINYQYPQNVPIHANDKNLSRYTFYNNTSSIFDTYTYETPLLRAVKAKDVEKVKLLIEQPSLNHVKSLMIGSIFESIKNDDIKIFNILLKTIDNNVNICNDCQTSLLIASICRSSKRICEEILKSEKFDTKQNNIIYAFTKCLQERTFSIKIANLLIDFDSKHEHLIDFNTQIPSGDTYLTLLKNNYQIDSKKIEFLFKHGADPNIPDKNGLYPLEIAIRNKNDNYVSLLLESGKVDLNQKIPVKINSFQEYQKSTKVKADEYTSYLHLSISRRQENENEIFKMLLDKETINIEDSKGNTPLMEACLCRNGYAIKQLFNFQELDYLHRNKQGQDALSIIDSDSNKPPQNKSEYKNALMSALRKNNKEKFSYGRFNFG